MAWLLLPQISTPRYSPAEAYLGCKQAIRSTRQLHTMVVYGFELDPMVGNRTGGINVFGGGGLFMARDRSSSGAGRQWRYVVIIRSLSVCGTTSAWVTYSGSAVSRGTIIARIISCTTSRTVKVREDSVIPNA
jgi:hypothetical protein